MSLLIIWNRNRVFPCLFERLSDFTEITNGLQWDCGAWCGYDKACAKKWPQPGKGIHIIMMVGAYFLCPGKQAWSWVLEEAIPKVSS